jgi:hypothetical protein
MVLYNEIEAETATFTMYTNIESRKGRAHTDFACRFVDAADSRYKRLFRFRR